MKPNESLFKTHLEAGPYLAGTDSGKWGLHGVFEENICPILWVRADKRIEPRGRIHLRFNIDNYPQAAPTGCPWDVTVSVALPPERWPKGGGNIPSVFNPSWNRTALYAPCDRVAMQGHEAWKTLCPQWWWTPTSTIVLYLEFVHVCLNPVDYEND
jgi:hypothetical protein